MSRPRFTPNRRFIDCVMTEHTGGNVYVDLVVLRDGRVLGVTDECVVLYPSIDHFRNSGPVEDLPTISLTFT